MSLIITTLPTINIGRNSILSRKKDLFAYCLPAPLTGLSRLQIAVNHVENKSRNLKADVDRRAGNKAELGRFYRFAH